MKKLTTKWFYKWSKKAKLTHENLLDAVENLENGLGCSDLGSYLFKVRVKREHSGKSSGFRTIIIYSEGEKAIFVYGFGKNERENITTKELQYFKTLANDLIYLDNKKVEELVEEKILFDLEMKE